VKGDGCKVEKQQIVMGERTRMLVVPRSKIPTEKKVVEKSVDIEGNVVRMYESVVKEEWGGGCAAIGKNVG